MSTEKPPSSFNTSVNTGMLLLGQALCLALVVPPKVSSAAVEMLVTWESYRGRPALLPSLRGGGSSVDKTEAAEGKGAIGAEPCRSGLAKQRE